MAKKKAKKKPKKSPKSKLPEVRHAEMVAVKDLKSHPKNYRSHPEDQLEHLVQSIKEHGFYRNVVVARDNTILAGHGVVEASGKLGLKEIAVTRLDIDPESPAALKVLTGDNTISNLAEDDDRALSELLKQISEQDNLLGTGFDDTMLAAFAMVTRPMSEISGMDEAAEWVGMPEYEQGKEPFKMVICFDSEEDRQTLIDQLGVILKKKTGLTWSTWWPPREREDLASVRFEG